MDVDSFNLLRRLIDGQLARLREVLRQFPLGRGSIYVLFVDKHLEALDELVRSSSEAFDSADADARVIYGHKLIRIRWMLGEFHKELFDYRHDVGRQDIPPGLLYLVDDLIADLLKASADPVIHMDGSHMYSTQRLVDRWRLLSGELGVVWAEVEEPIIFNLPGLDAGNALLAPILAHEVGHSVLDRTDLVSEVGARAADEIEILKEEIQGVLGPDVGIDAPMKQFASWIEELLCDALATELTGPSLLFSSAVFLPASHAGHSGEEHPDASIRISLALMQLKSLGWLETLEARCPRTLSYLRQTALQPAAPAPPADDVLRRMVMVSMSSIVDVAHEYVASPFRQTEYEPLESEIAALLFQGIPPAEINGSAVMPWHVVLAIWLHGIQTFGDSVEHLVEIAEDKSLSRLALKTIEMGRVLALWRIQ